MTRSDAHDDTDSGPPTGGRRSDSRLGLEGRTREGSSGRVGREERTDRVGDSDGDELLVGVDLVPVEPTERLGDGNVFEQEDDSRDGNLARHGADELAADVGRADVLEAGRDRLENRDRVLLGVLVDRDAPGDDGEQDDDERVSGDGGEERQSLPLGVTLLNPIAGPLEGVEDGQGGNSHGGVEVSVGQILERVAGERKEQKSVNVARQQERRTETHMMTW